MGQQPTALPRQATPPNTTTNGYVPQFSLDPAGVSSSSHKAVEVYCAPLSVYNAPPSFSAASKLPTYSDSSLPGTQSTSLSADTHLDVRLQQVEAAISRAQTELEVEVSQR